MKNNTKKILNSYYGTSIDITGENLVQTNIIDAQNIIHNLGDTGCVDVCYTDTDISILENNVNHMWAYMLFNNKRG